MYWSKLNRLFRPGRHVTKKVTDSIVNFTTPGSARFLTTANAGAAAPTQNEKENPPRAKIDLDFLIKNSDLPHWVHSPIDYDLYKAENLDELFAVVDRYRLDGLQASAFFVRLTKFTPINTLKLALDTRFKFCFDIFVREANAMPLSQILVALRSLLIIGFRSDHTICLEIQDVILNRLKTDSSLPLSALVYFTCFHVDYDTDASSSNEKSCFQKTLEDFLTSKMAFIHDLNNILLMMKKLSKNNDNNNNDSSDKTSNDQTIKFGHSLLLACEYRALELLDSATTEDLANILQCEAAAKSRNLILIKAVVQKLDAVPDQLGLKRTISVLTALNSLNYFTKSIISKIFVELNVILADGHLKKPYDFRFLCTQIFTGRFRDENLIDKLTEWFSKNMEVCKTDDLIAYLSMCAKCNVEKIPDRLVDDIKMKIDDREIADKQTLLEYVWSLAVLKKMDVKLGKRILNDGLVESVSKQGTMHRNTITKLKILNICAAMKYDLKVDSFKDYGKLESFTKDLKIVPRKQKIAAIETFLESLYLLAPKETYVRPSSISPFGYMIDACIYLSKENKPIPIAKKDQNSSAIPTVFVVLDRADYTQLSYCLNGLNAMAARHLTSSGCRVVQVSATEILKQATVIDRVNYVKLLIDNYSTSDLDSLDARS